MRASTKYIKTSSQYDFKNSQFRASGHMYSYIEIGFQGSNNVFKNVLPKILTNKSETYSYMIHNFM